MKLTHHFCDLKHLLHNHLKNLFERISFIKCKLIKLYLGRG